MSQLQQLSLSKSLDESAMKKRVAETAARHLAVTVSVVQPVTSMNTKQSSSTVPRLATVTEGVKSETLKTGHSLSHTLLDQ